MIEIKNLSFSYGKGEFIDSLNISFPDSTVTAIIGENGSGKSTLISLISKELPLRSGSIEIDGEPLQKLTKTSLARAISVFPQNRQTPDMTALELVLMGRYPYIKDKFITPKSETELALSALSRVEAAEFATRKLSSLSYGERQRVYLAMQIAQEAQNLILDEPTNFLDVSAKFRMMQLLLTLKNEGRCVIAILHDLPLAFMYADRIAVMKEGKLIALGSPDGIYKSGCIEETFGVRLEKSEGKSGIFYSILPQQQ